MGAIAPEGTAWARETKAATREVEVTSQGSVVLKWYLGGIQGDEMEELRRVRNGQLDGIAGASICEAVAPSLRILHVIGLVQTRDEGRYLMSRLRPTLDEEFEKSGVVGLGVEPFGMEILWSRTPIANLSDLKRTKVWMWELAETFRRSAERIGLHVVPMPVETAGRAFDDHAVDALVGVPTAAVAYQWTARVKAFTPLNLGLLPGCVIVSRRIFETLNHDQQDALRSAIAKLLMRFDQIGHMLDDQLLGTVIEKQGIQKVPVSDAFRREFLAAAQKAYSQPGLVPPELLAKAQKWLAEYRAQHHD
jgi:TRAP-type C4-dicarboxylate transport system substrate-binding protein